jgi:hypothetical protein
VAECYALGRITRVMIMTTKEAQRFATRCRRILVPWFARTDAEAVRDMERSCYGVIIGMEVIIGCNNKLSSSWEIVVAVSAFVVLIIAFWLSLRLRAIRRMFDSAGPQAFSDLK